MTMAVTAPPSPRPGHCSRCGKVWTLTETQGTCQWCGKRGICQQRQGRSRAIKSRRRKQRQVDGTGTGYDRLPEPYLTYHNVAIRFAHMAIPQDRGDLLHDIILHLARVAESKRGNGDKPFTEAMMYRTASHVKDHYWYDHYRHTAGLDCGHCSKAQRHKCKEDWLYADCPKAIKLESLNKPMLDEEGNLTELGELIADDKALDLAAWVDARIFIHGAPRQLKGIAIKMRDGETLTATESQYLWRFRKQAQKRLEGM